MNMDLIDCIMLLDVRALLRYTSGTVLDNGADV